MSAPPEAGAYFEFHLKPGDSGEPREHHGAGRRRGGDGTVDTKRGLKPETGVSGIPAAYTQSPRLSTDLPRV